jgi:hypothetical protein
MNTSRKLRPPGVAIVMVIAILAGLMALAAPFVFSMMLQGRSARSDLHALRARQGAEAAVSHAMAQAYNTLPRRPVDDDTFTPEVTTLQDLKVQMDFSQAPTSFDKLNVDVSNPDGTLWSAHIEDEQGKVNVNSAPPALIGNLLGSAILSEGVHKGDNMLVVDDAHSFSVAGDGTGVGGVVGIEGELLRFKDIQGTSILLIDAPQTGHGKGALVYDGRGRKISDYRIRPDAGVPYHPYASTYEIKCAGAITPDDFARIERSITAQSGIDGPLWGHGVAPDASAAAVNPLGAQNVQNGQPAQQNRLPPVVNDGMIPDKIFRIVTNGKVTGFGRVPYNGWGQARNGLLTFAQRLGPALNDPNGAVDGNNVVSQIEPEMRHPININTASLEVIQAVLTGLCPINASDAVSRSTAMRLAEFLTKNKSSYQTKEEVRKAFEDACKHGIITGPERDACIINATEPDSPKLRTATVPFCFHSFGSFTIEGTGIENSDNGVQFARNTIRQLVSLPTPQPGRFRIQGQQGFQDLMDKGQTQRMVTFPLPVAKYRFSQNAPDYTPLDPIAGNIRLDVAYNTPIPTNTLLLYDPCNDASDPGFRQDGYDMNKRQPWKLQPNPGVGQNPGGGAVQLATLPREVELWYRPLGNGQCVFYEEGLEEERNRLTFSYEPRGQVPGLCISVYDAGLECKDSPSSSFQHLKRRPMQYVYPVTFDAGDWYHIAGSWKSGQPQGFEIRVDAQPMPNPRDNNGEQDIKPGTRLNKDLSLDEVMDIELENMDNADFPKSGAIKIGEEIIEYQKRTGKGLNTLFRGARMSAISKHSSGEWVVPYGYSNTLAQTLRVGGGTLVEDMDTEPNSNGTVNMPTPPNKQNFVLDTATDKLPANNITGFPKSGYILCAGEVLYYARRDALAFYQLTRAFKGPARNLHHGQGIHLVSFQISDHTQYDPSGIVQIDETTDDKKVEWIGYGSKEVDNGMKYMVAHLGVVNSAPIRTGPLDTPSQGNQSYWGVTNTFRHYFGIGIPMGFNNGPLNDTHSKKAKVIPVVRMTAPFCGNQYSPYGDNGVSEVSVIEKGTTDGDLRYVKQAYINQYANTNNQPCPQLAFTSWGFDFFVGLNDFVSRDYPVGPTRFLKWPSGELPDAVGATPHVCSDRNGEGTLHGHVDEVIVQGLKTQCGRIAMTTEGEGIKPGDDTINVEPIDAWPVNGNAQGMQMWPPTGGLIRIEDEVMFYKTATQAQIDFYADVFPPLKDKPPEQNKADRRWVNPCTKEHELHPNIHQRRVMRLNGVIRGLFGTQGKEHPVGAAVMLFDGMPCTALSKNVASNDDTFSVHNGAGFPFEGYALIGNDRNGSEVISWTRNNGNSFSGCQNFRGRFGTEQAEHQSDDIVRCLPARYWDRDVTGYDGKGTAYVQAGYSAPDAIWDTVELVLEGTEELPKPGNVRPHVLVRFDGQPGWDAEPTNTPGGLYEFNGQERMPLGHVRGDQMEVRVYWHYKSGAFQPQMDWKRTFSLNRLRGIYHTPLIVRRRDEIEKR